MLQSISQWNWLKKKSLPKLWRTASVTQCYTMCFPQATCNTTAGWKTTKYKYATVRQGVRYHILFFCCKENLEQWERRTTRLSTDILQLSDRTMGEQSAGHAIQIVPCLIFKVWHIFCSCSHFSWECWNMWNGLQQPQAKKYKLILQLL